MSFAGLWERWEREGEAVETFTLLTTAASPGLIAIRHRQPSIIEPDAGQLRDRRKDPPGSGGAA